MVVFTNSVIVFVPLFLCWGWLLSRYDFRPIEVLLLFGLTGTLAETITFGPQNLIQVGMWVFVYGLMVYLCECTEDQSAMNLVTEPYPVQTARWPSSGRHILAHFDDESIIAYQAYRPAIGHFAARNGFFGGEFSLNRMSWVKPNFLWMMYRCGWGSNEGQEVVLAVRLKRSAFRGSLPGE